MSTFHGFSGVKCTLLWFRYMNSLIGFQCVINLRVGPERVRDELMRIVEYVGFTR